MRKPHLHLYGRISDDTQRAGSGLTRQAEADALAKAKAFGDRFGFVLAPKVWIDDGVSAFNPTNNNLDPRHQLGQFLAAARRGVEVRPGDCLLVEVWDRLCRQGPWAAVGFASDLRRLGIHMGRLENGKLIRCDSDDLGDFFEYSLEAARGHNESKAKQYRNGDAMERKRQAAREGKKQPPRRRDGRVTESVTDRLPAWVSDVEGKLVLNDKAEVVRYVVKLAMDGYGTAGIVKRLTAEKVPPISPRLKPISKKASRRYGETNGGAHWSRSYIALLLSDRRICGDFGPRNGPPDKVIAGYYPQVITPDEFNALRVRVRRRQPRRTGGPCRPARPRRPRRTGEADAATPRRTGAHVNPFAGLLKDARDGGSYYVATRCNHGVYRRVLLNVAASEGRATAYTFPYLDFEAAVFSRLQEINAGEILNGGEATDEVAFLIEQLEGVEIEYAEAKAYLDVRFSNALADKVADLEAKKAALAEKKAEAEYLRAHPLSAAWGEVSALVATDALTAEQRTRLKQELARVVQSIQLLVVPRGRVRLCAVQIHFAGGRHRSYLILHTPPQANQHGPAHAGTWSVRSFAAALGADDLDLRNREDAADLERELAAVDLTP
jgi:hypothetical protein